MYNFIEQDLWTGKFTLKIYKNLKYWYVDYPRNFGWNLPLESWEVGQLTGGN